ncbi:MAG: hypothetical protein RhofKO_19900 [Rhodothermales bacterium]
MYNERDIQTILKRTAEFERAMPSKEPTLSEADLYQLADEVGISRTAMQKAIRDTQDASLGNRLRAIVKRPKHHSSTFTQRLDVPLTDAVWHGLIERLRAQFNRKGTVYYAGAIREWRYKREGEQMVVTIRPDEGRTRITVFAQQDHVPNQLMEWLITGALVTGVFAAAPPDIHATVVFALIFLLPLIFRYLPSTNLERKLTKQLAHTRRAIAAIESMYAPPPAQLASTPSVGNGLVHDLEAEFEAQPTADPRVRASS